MARFFAEPGNEIPVGRVLRIEAFRGWGHKPQALGGCVDALTKFLAFLKAGVHQCGYMLCSWAEGSP